MGTQDTELLGHTPVLKDIIKMRAVRAQCGDLNAVERIAAFRGCNCSINAFAEDAHAQFVSST